jgi:hypothetical protein
MQYVPPLRLLAGLGDVERSDTSVTLPLEAFQAVLRAAFSGPAFDATWYSTTYPDVAFAISQAIVPDEITHFVRFGYFEGRRPRSFDVDVRWYEETYEDVAEAIRAGAISDARSHYNSNGYFEPRAPDAQSAAAFATFLYAAAIRADGPTTGAQTTSTQTTNTQTTGAQTTDGQTAAAQMAGDETTSDHTTKGHATDRQTPPSAESQKRGRRTESR